MSISCSMWETAHKHELHPKRDTTYFGEGIQTQNYSILDINEVRIQTQRENSLKLKRWQGPPHVNEVKWCEIVLSFKVVLFIQFIYSWYLASVGIKNKEIVPKSTHCTFKKRHQSLGLSNDHSVGLVRCSWYFIRSKLRLFWVLSLYGKWTVNCSEWLTRVLINNEWDHLTGTPMRVLPVVDL